MAAATLARVGVHSSNVVMIITKRLPRASIRSGYIPSPVEIYLWALGEFGSLSHDALPMICGFTNSPDIRVRLRANESIERINHAVANGVEKGSGIEDRPAIQR